MQFQSDTELHQQMAGWFARGKVAVFCGAGVSQEPPAGLPGWHKLRDYTLEAVALREGLLAKYLPHLTALPMMAEPGKKGLTPEVVASQIVGNCSGYFECFRSLEEGEPNANHRYLAKMAKAGHLRHILTTNFDLFIEQGMQQEGVAYQVHRTEEEFASFTGEEDGALHLFKLHGCISEPDTIIATVEQEG